MGITVFGMFLFVSLPGLIEYNGAEWERILNDNEIENEFLSMFESHKSYIAMYEKYPNATQEYTSNERGEGHLSVAVMNYETNNHLTLNLSFYSHNNNIQSHVMCYNADDDNTQYIDSPLDEDFIRNGNCLDVIITP